MDLFVELPDGTTKLVPVSMNCSARAATQSTVLRAGMAPVASKLSEFSLAKKTDSPNPLVNVHWLDEGLKVKNQGGDDGTLHLILLKKYYSTNTDMSVLKSSNVLLKNLYSQFRLAYVCGLYSCTQSQAVQLSALIARAEFSFSELRPGSLQKTGRLEMIVPPLYITTPDMEQNILMALGSLARLTELQAQERFIELVSQSETFGLSMHTITLVESVGERREALLGVGPQHISVLETANLHILMQWKTSELTGHSFNDTTFSMNYGSECVTVVTKQGHMISAFLLGMAASNSIPSNAAPGNKRPLKPQRSAGTILENGLRDDNGLSDHNYSTHIKSVGKQVKRYEVELQKSRPVIPPRPAHRGRPPQPHKPRHMALRGTRSVPIQPKPNPGLPQSLIQQRIVDISARGDRGEEGAVYEVPVMQKPTGARRTEGRNSTPQPKWEEVRYEVNDAIEEELPQSVGKVRPLLPPPPHMKKPPLKKAISHATGKNKTEHFVPKVLRRTHKSDSDIAEKEAGEELGSPIYDELIPAPEYAELENQSPVLSRDRNGKNHVVKRKSQLPPVPLPTLTPTHNITPFSPPPPSSPAPPPPSETMERATTKPSRPSMSHAPPPRTPAPEPPIYDTLTPEDDLKEIEHVFGSKDLPMQVKFSCDTNPIYDTLAATKVKTSLSASEVTYHSFTLERQKKRKLKQPKPPGQPQVISPTPPLPSSSSPSLPISPSMYENSELISILSKDISPRASPTNPEPETRPSEQLRASPRKKTPSPPLTRGISGAPVIIGLKPVPVLPMVNGAPSNGYSRLEHFKNPTVEPTTRIATTADEEEHEYAEVDHNAPRTTKAGRRKLKSWMMLQDAGSAPPVPPMRGTEAEARKIGPPKPPRARQRWEKMVDKGEGKGHKAVKNTDALRDYSTLMQEFRMFHVKLPTGIIHTELANVKTELAKLIKRLCVLMCVDEEDHTHYSLYVEGTPFTYLSEMGEEEGGDGMFRRLRQKSPSRSDLFNNKSFAVLSERSTNPVLLDPSLSLRSQGITTARVLALRPQTVLPRKPPRFQIRVPDWVRFHQCWLSVVQGNLMTTQTEAIKLAALQYQAYFLDRTELNSVIGFCRSCDFLPHDYSAVKGIEEKVFAEQQRLKGYTRRHAQDSYIFIACALPTYNAIFFHCMEAKRKLLRIGNTKLASVLIGMSKEGVVRADYKTKEILDVWPYQVLKNWGYTEQTFIIEFDDRSYPLKTSQGRWMNALVDFHIEAILGDMTTPPVTHQEMGGANVHDEVILIHNRDDVDEIYSDLLSVREQAQAWLAESNKPSSSSTTSPPSSPPTPHTPSSAPISPSQSHATSVITNTRSPDSCNQTPECLGVYEEVDFEPSPPRTVGFYDVIRKEDDDVIYDLPPNS